MGGGGGQQILNEHIREKILPFIMNMIVFIPLMYTRDIV